MNKKFGLVALGTGSAASTVASKCRSAGWQVAIVDSRPFGGTCALRGCDPKKVLVGAADGMDWLRRMERKGIRNKHARIDWAELMKFKRSFTDPVPESREANFAKAGIVTYHGRAHFVGPNTVRLAKMSWKRDMLSSRPGHSRESQIFRARNFSPPATSSWSWRNCRHVSSSSAEATSPWSFPMWPSVPAQRLRCFIAASASLKALIPIWLNTVSYTHLTLPTICSV